MRKVLILGSGAVCLMMLLVTLLLHYLEGGSSEKRIIREAIDAHGGTEALRRIKAGRLAGQGVRHGGFQGAAAFSWEESFAHPDRYKLVMRPKEAFTVMYIAPAKKWWTQEGDAKPVPKAGGGILPASQLEPLRQLVEIERQQMPMTLVGDDEVNFRPAVAVRVDSGEWGHVTYSFDKAKGILLRMRGQLDRGDTPVIVERVYSNHREVKGVLVPMKVTMFVNGRLDTEMTITEIELVDQLDPSTFAPP